MQIGKRYADNKLYRGIQHYNSLPLTANDLHEGEDTLYRKSELLTRNLVGSGFINKPGLEISSTGVKLKEPAVLLLDGDVVMIQSDQELLKLDYLKGLDEYKSYTPVACLCIVGWYQRIDSETTLRNYGGVRNDPLPVDDAGNNDIVDPDLKTQVSARYQFRWDILPVLSLRYKKDHPTARIRLYSRDSNGDLITDDAGSPEVINLTASRREDGIYIIPRGESSTAYAKSDIYVIPFMDYNYNLSIDTFSEIYLLDPLKLAKSYSLNTYRYKVDIPFTESNSEIDILLNDIGLEYSEEDKLQVSYEGLLLIEGEHYTTSSDRTQITLNGVTLLEGTSLVLEITKIEENE